MSLESHKYIRVSSPSNIAFVKYWGKKDNQIPMNSSISMTLKKSYSLFEIEFIDKQAYFINSFLFENEKNEKFQKKIELFLSSVADQLNILNKYSLNISCKNTFPHSAGVASSASAMSALMFGIMSFDNQKNEANHSLMDISHFARLASGSASRSLYPYFSIWDVNSPKYAKQLHQVNTIFLTLNDAILLIDTSEKAISSSRGHELMNNHPFKASRIEQAQNNITRISSAMKNGDIQAWGEILEEEALSLHSLMMSSNPSFILMKPNTLAAIDKIRRFRNLTKIPSYFTLDAGANIHLLYFDKDKKDVELFIETELKSLCEEEKVLFDCIGNGPQVIEISI